MSDAIYLDIPSEFVAIYNDNDGKHNVIQPGRIIKLSNTSAIHKARCELINRVYMMASSGYIVKRPKEKVISNNDLKIRLGTTVYPNPRNKSKSLIKCYILLNDGSEIPFSMDCEHLLQSLSDITVTNGIITEGIKLGLRNGTTYPISPVQYEKYLESLSDNKPKVKTTTVYRPGVVYTTPQGIDKEVFIGVGYRHLRAITEPEFKHLVNGFEWLRDPEPVYIFYSRGSLYDYYLENNHIILHNINEILDYTLNPHKSYSYGNNNDAPFFMNLLTNMSRKTRVSRVDTGISMYSDGYEDKLKNDIAAVRSWLENHKFTESEAWGFTKSMDKIYIDSVKEIRDATDIEKRTLCNALYNNTYIKFGDETLYGVHSRG